MTVINAWPDRVNRDFRRSEHFLSEFRRVSPHIESIWCICLPNLSVLSFTLVAKLSSVRVHSSRMLEDFHVKRPFEKSRRNTLATEKLRLPNRGLQWVLQSSAAPQGALKETQWDARLRLPLRKLLEGLLREGKSEDAFEIAHWWKTLPLLS